MIPSRPPQGGMNLHQYMTGQIRDLNLTESMFEEMQLEWIIGDVSNQHEATQNWQATQTLPQAQKVPNVNPTAQNAYAPLLGGTTAVPTNATVERKQAAFRPLKITNNQTELEMLKNSALYIREDMRALENPKFDKKEPNRAWDNWQQECYVPIKASMIVADNVDKMMPGPPPFVEGQRDPALDDLTFAQQLKICQSKGEKFRDHRFLSEPKSIIGTEFDYPQHKEKLTKSPWNRPEAWSGGSKYEVFSPLKVDPDSVKQGELGDCYLLAPLSSLALKPERVKKLVKMRKVNDQGIYMVTFCLHGVWENITIDNKFPCLPSPGNQLVFASSQYNDIWVPLVEKAWAKIHFGYFNIESGTIEESMHALTGAPVVHYVLNETNPQEDTWEQLYLAPRKGFVIAASSRELKGAAVDRKGVDASTGLVRSHAYSITASYEIKFDGRGVPSKIVHDEPRNPNNLRLVRLRNPWAGTEWKGAWCDSDSRWTPELINVVGLSQKNDGLFWMSYPDFCKYFNSFVVCEVKDDYHFSGIKIKTQVDKPTILKFEIKKPGNFSFTLNQISKRMFTQDKEYAYTACSLMIARISSQGVILNKGFNHAMSQLVTVKQNCEPGTYIAYICTPWRRKVNEIGFEIYGPEFIETVTHLPENKIDADFVNKFMLDHARTRTEKERKTFKDLGLPDIGYLTHITPSGMGYIMFDNKSKDVQLTAMLKFSNPKETVFYPSAGDDSRLELVVVPGKMKIVVFRMIRPDSGFSYQQFVSFDPQYEKVCQNIESKGKLIPKLYNEQECGVYLKEYKFSNGFGYLFVNNSKSLEFSEKVEFVLKNARLTGEENAVYVKLRPGKKRLVMVTAEDSKKPWVIQIIPGPHRLTPFTNTVFVSYAAEFK